MKNPTSSFAGALLLALALITNATATPITGSIAFNGVPHFNVLPISGADAITSFDSAFAAFDQQTGAFAPVPNFLPVTFSPFTFSPASQPITPLWKFNSLGVTYSFDTSSLVA